MSDQAFRAKLQQIGEGYKKIHQTNPNIDELLLKDEELQKLAQEEGMDPWHLVEEIYRNLSRD